jgi:hypothetical protein
VLVCLQAYYDETGRLEAQPKSGFRLRPSVRSELVAAKSL